MTVRRCGAIFPGDQIVAVNETRVAGLRTAASDVYKLLRTCGGVAQSTLRLEIIPAFIATDFVHADCKLTFCGAVGADRHVSVLRPTVRNEKRFFFAKTPAFCPANKRHAREIVSPFFPATETFQILFVVMCRLFVVRFASTSILRLRGSRRRRRTNGLGTRGNA